METGKRPNRVVNNKVWLVMILTLSLYFFSCMNIGIANDVGEGSHIQGE